MNSYEIGRAFEKEAYKFLKKEFDVVNWVSKKCWTSPFDFECYKDGKRFLIDAKSNRSICIQRKENVNLFITKIHNEIKIIPPIRINFNKKIKVELEEDIVDKLFELKNYGDTYSDVLRRLLEK